ncbi:hypothetical protein LLE49_19490 [Alicyclobacillus tolerans]|uniref:hypothetical protein n=1 Tax=Alicyclobacillus tolerans TaxID=90970 RepID=UPI001F1CAA7A|nr:hypothetical protein [Alicyclobacillus tolerans]MCF8566906.1 hypothetical protein [Alicyclobacillus tolerans]
MLVNRTGEPKKHPITGQIIMPGQSYMEPEDSERVELVESDDPGILVQTVADPEATRKAIREQRKQAGGQK